MKLKPLLAVVAVLAVLSAIVFWRQRTPETAAGVDPRVGQSMLTAEVLRETRSLAITGSDKQTVTVVADATGAQWTVSEYHGLPADFDKLASTMESLRSAKIERSIASAAAQERLGFAGEKIELKDGAGKILTTLHLGKTIDSGGRFIRYGEEKKSYVSDLSAWIDATPKNWAQSQLLKLKPEDVAALEFKFQDGSTVTAKRNAEGNGWTAENLPEGKELKASTIDSTVSQLTGLRFSETTATDAPEAVDAKAHTSSVGVTLKNGTSYTIALGRRPAPPAAAPATPPATGSITATTPPVGIDGATGQVIKPDIAATQIPMAVPPPADPAAPAATPAPPPEPGPVYAFISANRAEEPVNAVMQKRAFQIGDWIYTSLPANRDALLQDKPKPVPAPAAMATPPATPSVPAPTPAATPEPAPKP